MANVSSNNLTTLYSGGGVNVRPTSAYGNANVVALLNVGTDGGNTVTNIVATGNMTIGNITANGNVTADYFIGNLIGNVTGNIANANYANFAGTAFNVSGSNVTGYVANATHSNVADVANSVAGANVSGQVSFAAVANSVAGANVTGYVANATHSNVADVANSVSVANVVGIGNIAVINLDGNVSNVLHGNGYWGPESGNLNANYANFAGTLINGTSNITIPVANGNITFSANGVANLAVLDTTGNLTVNNEIIAQSANLAGSYDILSIGTYYPLPLVFGNYGSPNLSGYTIVGDYTSGSNLITNVTLYDGFGAYPASLTDNATELTGQGLGWGTGTGTFNDTYIPLLTTIDSVDVPNNQIYMSNNATLSGSGVFAAFTGSWLSNSSSNSYWIASQAYVTNAISTDGTSNSISVTEFGLFNDGFINSGQIVQFYGTSFGNITSGTSYYVNNIDYGNSTFTISTTNGGPDVALTTATGDLNIVLELASQNWQPLSAGYYFAGPWNGLPTIANLTQTPSGYISGGTTISANGYFVKPVDFNYGQTPPVVYSGQYTRVDNGLVISDGSYGTPTLTGLLSGQSPVNGVTLLHTGLDANINGSRTNYQIVDYTENSSGAASITNPLNPPALSFTSYNGNVNGDPNDQYARSGRTLGRVAWYGTQQVGGVKYDIPGSSPHAGIYVQALGDWNDSTNANLPMTMSFQYSPLNAATGSGSNYQRINRTFLQASNNSTYIGGATDIQFKPLARSGSGTNNRSPSALGNSSINPQTFVDISGYTQGNAVSNGAGAVLNVTTTDSNWDGNVALRLSRTVGNTANVEFVLPQASSNTLVLVDNSSGNTIATFTDGLIDVNGNITAGNINGGNLVSANFLTGDGYLISNLTVAGGTQIVNGNTNVSALANGNVTFDIAGVSNVLVITNSGADLTGTFTSTVANIADLYMSNANIHIGTDAGVNSVGTTTINLGVGAGGGGNTFTAGYISYDSANQILQVTSTTNLYNAMRISGTGFDGTQQVLQIIDAGNLYCDPPISTPSGTLSFNSGQQANTISIGYHAGFNNQQPNNIAIGVFAGSNNQFDGSIAIGSNAGAINQNVQALAIGFEAGYSNQGPAAFAMGNSAGRVNQGSGSIAIGWNAGYSNQISSGTAIGRNAGSISQGQQATAIGAFSGNSNQGTNSVAVGFQAGRTTQGAQSVALGSQAGANAMGNNSVAIGFNAGNNQMGANSVAIGFAAGRTTQAVNSIILNATGANLNQTTANTFTVKPVRNLIQSNAVFYNSSTGEISYDTLANNTSNVGAGNITVTGNISTSNLSVTGTGNIATFNATTSGNVANLQLNRFQETVYSIGSTSGTITPDFINGSIQSMTLTGSITMNSLANAVAGRSMVLIITQGGTGSYTLTSSMKFAGAYKTLSTTVGATDIISVFYDGTTYYASLSSGYA